MAILAILLLGLLGGLITSMTLNLRTYLRDEAKFIALECAENIRNSSYELIPPSGSVSCNAQGAVAVDNPCTDLAARIASGTPEQVRRQIRNASASYTIGWSVATNDNVKAVQIQVCWNYMGRQYSHTITTVVGRSSR